MTALRDIQGEALVQWAELIEAQHMLPDLVRRLLLASAPLRSISMPAGSGVRLEGWDGIVFADEGGPFWPAGPSVWELSVDKKVRPKLNKDFKKRKEQVAPADAARMTYVALTARRFGQTQKADWAAEKRREGVWADVLVYDADDLAAWLAQTPAVACWFSSSALAQPTQDLTDVEAFLRRWSRRGRTLPLPFELAVAGRQRQNAAESVRSWLTSSRPQPLHVRGDTREEALLFVSAALATAPGAERTRLLAQALVVESREAWRWAVRAQQAQPHILLPGFEEFDLGEASTRSAFVVVPEDASASGQPHILLEPIPFKPFAEVLAREGVRETDAERLARESGGKLSAYQHLAGYHAPPLLNRQDEGPLNAMLLVGAWTPSNDADREVLRQLGASPEAVEQLCVAKSREPGTPILADTEWGQSKSWRWASSAEAWKRLAKGLSERQIHVFAKVALAVLRETDPRYDIPKNERFYADSHGKTLRHSKALREGLAESIVRLALSDEEFKATYRVSLGSQSAQSIVRQLLTPDWKRWASLSNLLPILAEAAPEEFLGAVDKSLDQGDKGVSHLLEEEDDSIMGHSPHPDLLWALEALGWNESLMPRVADILARLAERDPGGRLANRPQASLTHMLHAALPQTSASLNQRLKVLGSIMERRPIIGWNMAFHMVEELQGAISLSSSHRPRYLPWLLPPEGRPVSEVDLKTQLTKTFELLVSSSGQQLDRWVKLLELAPQLPENLSVRILEELRAIHRHLEDEKGRLWAKVRDGLNLLYLLKPELSPAANTLLELHLELYEALSPTDVVTRFAWLFQHHPRLPEPESEDLQKSTQRINELRLKAVTEIWSHANRWEFIQQLAENSEVPEFLGTILGEAPFAEEARTHLLEQEPTPPAHIKLTPSFIARRFALMQQDEQWLEQILQNLASRGRVEEAARAADLLRSRMSLWRLLDRIGDPLRATYWQKASNVDAESPEEWEFAIKNLLDHGQEQAAITAAHQAKDKLSAELTLNILEQLRKSLQDHERWKQRERSVDAYLLEHLFKRLDRSLTIDTQRIISLEIFFFHLLRNTKRKIEHLFNTFESNPALIAELVGMLYRKEHEEEIRRTSEFEEAVDQQAIARARLASGILSDWNGVPGVNLESADKREEALFAWSTKVLELTSASGHESGGIIEVARVLARAGPAADGAWPRLAARRLLEREGSERLARNIYTAKRNLRGVYSKSLQEGGAQERELAANFKEDADKLRTEWPRTAALLDNIASSYLRDAEKEDAEARSERLKYGWEPEAEAPLPSSTTTGEQHQANSTPASIECLELRGISSAPTARLELAPRLNLLAGDSSMGKTLVLDVLWWAQSGTWAGAMALPQSTQDGAAILVGSTESTDVESHFDATQGQWGRPPQWPVPQALSLYARVDGSFSVWDSIRNAESSSSGRPHTLPSYCFTPEALWNGLEAQGTTWCSGLVHDWLDWQHCRTGLFEQLKEVLTGLSLPDEPLRPGNPIRGPIHKTLDMPTLDMPHGTVPLIHSSAAVKRILGLAYLLVWSWSEHQEAARRAGRPLAERVLLLFDEVESHLPPKWQRLLLPSLLRAIQRLMAGVQVQVVASTHAPLVMASLEHHFNPEQDKVFRFALEQGRIVVSEQPWGMPGDDPRESGDK